MSQRLSHPRIASSSGAGRELPCGMKPRNWALGCVRPLDVARLHYIDGTLSLCLCWTGTAEGIGPTTVDALALDFLDSLNPDDNVLLPLLRRPCFMGRSQHNPTRRLHRRPR